MLRTRLTYGAMGAAGGLSGVLASVRCGGGGCTACFGCAGAGLLLLVAALVNRRQQVKKEGARGMAQVDY